ncbi:MAG: phosphoadenylyl-sulfate reductase [Pseudomonadales bacterium]
MAISDPPSLAHRLEGAHPQSILRRALEGSGRVAISFSGAEDVILLDMACQITDDVEVFSLDTGRLHPQTYRFIERVRNHYGIEIELMSPDQEALQDLIRRKGLFSFYRDGHQECCSVRKIEPLRRKLIELDGWVTGQRRDQSPTRHQVPVVQTDTAFSTDDHPIVKWNPLANWSSAKVWEYIRANDVPCNELHDTGFLSIGCEPCTRAIGPHEHERAGRWWWEEATQKECGLHSNNLEQPVRLVG